MSHQTQYLGSVLTLNVLSGGVVGGVPVWVVLDWVPVLDDLYPGTRPVVGVEASVAVVGVIVPWLLPRGDPGLVCIVVGLLAPSSPSLLGKGDAVEGWCCGVPCTIGSFVRWVPLFPFPFLFFLGGGWRVGVQISELGFTINLSQNGPVHVNGSLLC